MCAAAVNSMRRQPPPSNQKLPLLPSTVATTAVLRPQIAARIPTYKISMGCPILDGVLRGGVPCGSITELVGEAASGKTQICLQLALATTTNGGGAVLFLHSEHPFPLRRLLRLSACENNLDRSNHNNPSALDSDSSLDRVLVAGAYTPADLLALLSRADDLLISRTNPPIRLIIVDSIAALFRAEFDATPADLRRRSSIFFRISAKLREQAARFNVAVFVTNHVVDVIHSDGGVDQGSWNCKQLWTSGRQVAPALGIAWANCVNTRLFVSRRNAGTTEDGGATRRRMEVVFAPHLADTSACEFVITADGIFGIGRNP